MDNNDPGNTENNTSILLEIRKRTKLMVYYREINTLLISNTQEFSNTSNLNSVLQQNKYIKLAFFNEILKSLT